MFSTRKWRNDCRSPTTEKRENGSERPKVVAHCSKGQDHHSSTDGVPSTRSMPSKMVSSSIKLVLQSLFKSESSFLKEFREDGHALEQRQKS